MALIRELLPEDNKQVLHAKDELWSLGLDSLAMAHLSSRINSVFGVILPPSTLFALHTLGHIDAALFGSKNALFRAIGCSKIIKWKSEAQQSFEGLMELLKEDQDLLLQHVTDDMINGGDPSAQPSGKPSSSTSTVLLTGATGFLGPFLVQSLLAHCACDVVCVVRATTSKAACVRLKNVFQFYHLQVMYM